MILSEDAVAKTENENNFLAFNLKRWECLHSSWGYIGIFAFMSSETERMESFVNGGAVLRQHMRATSVAKVCSRGEWN